MVIVLICFSCNYFYLNQLACRYRKTISTMKFSFHPEYKYIFCLPSRRARRITVRALKIVYSFCSFGSSSFFVWQHSPDFSFSLECIPQHFVSSIGTFHIPLSHQRWLLLNHTYTFGTDIFQAYQNDLPQNNGIDNYSFTSNFGHKNP